MAEYHVEWSIDIEADTPEEAARMARAFQQWPRENYWCGVFHIFTEDNGEAVTIDLDELDAAAPAA